LDNIFSLGGKRALVAGASRGIGLAIAKGLAAAGAEVLLAARSLDKLKVEATAINGTAIELDITRSDSIRAAAEAAGDVDILVNVAGMNIRRAFEDYTREEYDRILSTNLHGIFELTQLVGKRMKARGKGGKIINIGSLMSIRGMPYLTVYAITKGALAQLTMTLAAEWGRDNIQVNCIAPGFILTALNQDMWQREDMKEWMRGIQANPNLGAPEDVAPLAVFLAGRGANYITGQVIAVDGGFTTTAVWPFQP
jgi:NAD(P)-dependent dehydrogenase (short-subunit alcohol dehydrogenase family)